MYPDNGPVRDLTRHAQSARSNPVRGPSQDLSGRAPGFERAPYGHARDAPWSPVQIPHGARPGFERASRVQPAKLVWSRTGFLWGVLGKVRSGQPWAFPYGHSQPGPLSGILYGTCSGSRGGVLVILLRKILFPSVFGMNFYSLSGFLPVHSN